MANVDLGGKTVLYMLDAIICAPSEGASITRENSRWQQAPFNGHYTASVFVSQDPVAIDSVGADFNGSVLAGQETKYGVQFITWDWSYDKTGVTQGHYYGPGGADSYTAAKQDFAVRSGLVQESALFASEQMTEIYRCIHETLDSEYPITEERRKLLETATDNR